MKKALAVVMLVVGAAVWGSPASLAVKAVEKAAEKSAVKCVAEKAGARAFARSTGKTLGKVVTPKTILATGAATAFVVGAHETADGVQTVGEGVAHAVEQNPDLAPVVAGSLSTTGKWLTLPLGIVLAVVLAWMLWPLVRLVRAAISLAAAKAAKQAGDSSGPANPAQQPAAAESGRVSVYLLLMVAAFGILAAMKIGRMAAPGGAAGWKARMEYVAEVDRAHEEFVKSVHAVASARYGDVDRMVPSVADRFGTMSRCCRLVKALATDKITEGHAAADAVNEELDKDFYQALYAARAAVGECVAGYVARLEKARSRYVTDMKGLGVTIQMPAGTDYGDILSDVSQQVELSKDQLREGQNAAAIDAAIELVCIRHTVSTAANLLGRIAAREAGAATFGAGAAVADGPFPVGDAVGGVLFLGCTAWSVWDIYQATQVLPEQLCISMHTAVATCRAQSVSDAEKIGDILRQAYWNAAG